MFLRANRRPPSRVRGEACPVAGRRCQRPAAAVLKCPISASNIRERFLPRRIQCSSPEEQDPPKCARVEEVLMHTRPIAALAILCLIGTSSLVKAADKPPDPQIAHIAYTAGVIDIAAAKLAISKSRNKDVVA